MFAETIFSEQNIKYKRFPVMCVRLFLKIPVISINFARARTIEPVDTHVVCPRGYFCRTCVWGNPSKNTCRRELLRSIVS